MYLATDGHLSGFCWSFILDINADLFRAIRKIVLMMIIIMIINRMLANIYGGLFMLHAIGFMRGTSFELHNNSVA